MTVAAAPKLRGAAAREYGRTQRGWFARKCLGQKPWPKQIEVEEAVFGGKHRRTEVSGCVGSTKTYAAAMIALQWLMCHKPARVFSIAPSFRQVDTNIWGYLQKLWAAAVANGTPLGPAKDIFKIPRIELGADWFYQGFATDKPFNLHGIHGDNDLVIIDDAQGIPQAVLDELENMMAGGNTRFLMLYNKNLLTGPTYSCTHVEAALYNHVGIAYADLVAARAAGFKLDGALGADAEVAWRTKYGAESDFYRVKVLNQHPKQERNTLIPLHWIEAAYEREVLDTGYLVIGGDVAAEGDDSCALAPMRGLKVGEVEEWHEDDTMASAGMFVRRMRDEEATGKSKAFAFIDAVGIGAGLVSRMAEQPGVKITGLKGSEDAEGVVLDGDKRRPAKEVFKNLRSQMYWNLRERLDPSKKNLIGLTRDNDLTAQLSCIRFRVGSDGRIEVEPKIGTPLSKGGTKEWGIKRRLGFSPDKADAVKYAVWGSERIGGGGVEASDDSAAPQATEDKYMTAAEPEAVSFFDGIEGNNLPEGIS